MPILSSTALEQLKKVEKFEAYPYWDVRQWSVGYGSFAGSTDRNKKPSIVVTKDTATALLLKEVQTFYTGLQKLLKVNLTQSQLDALILFVYNLGLGILTKPSSTFGVPLITDLNNKNFSRFAERMKRYDKVLVNGVYVTNDTLVKRRALESNVFTRGWDFIKDNPAATAGASLASIALFFCSLLN